MSKKTMNENLIKRAQRYLVEDDTDDMEADMGDEENTDTTDDVAGEELVNIEIFFGDLSENIQKTIMDSLKKSVNAADGDEYAEQKIVEQLSKKPIFVANPTDLQRQLQISI